MTTIMRGMKLRDLLEKKAGIHSSAELRQAIGGSESQASNLWHGRDSIGARVMLRILKAFPMITVADISQVEEAAKALTPPKPRRSRKKPPSP